MKILAVDTSGETCSVALIIGSDSEQLLAQEPRRHGELVLGMMDELLARAQIGLTQLDALAFGRGPGSFTGVRIATAVVQGAAFGADLPVVPVSTLAALARGQVRATGCRRILSALDARMGELYWGPYQSVAGDLVALVGEEQVAAPELVTLPSDGGWCGCGSGWSAHGDVLRQRMGARLSSIAPEAFCEAQDIAALACSELAEGRSVPAEQALPVYLRDRVTARP